MLADSMSMILYYLTHSLTSIQQSFALRVKESNHHHLLMTASLQSHQNSDTVQEPYLRHPDIILTLSRHNSSDMQKRMTFVTKDCKNNFIIAEIFSTNPPNILFSTKTIPHLCYMGQYRVFCQI